MTTNDMPQDEAPASKAVLSPGAIQVLGSALFLALISASAYLTGWFYCNEFFLRLGLHHESLDLPTFFYLEKSFAPLFLIGIALAFAVVDSDATPASSFRAFRANSWMIFLSFLFILLIRANEGPRWLQYIIFAISILTIIVCILASTIKYPLFLAFPRSSHLRLIVPPFFVILSGILLAGILGQRDAVAVGEGRHPNAVAEIFQTKKSFPQLENKMLILILHHDGKYFLVERQVPFPELPTVFIVPDDQVELAIQQRLTLRRK